MSCDHGSVGLKCLKAQYIKRGGSELLFSGILATVNGRKNYLTMPVQVIRTDNTYTLNGQNGIAVKFDINQTRFTKVQLQYFLNTCCNCGSVGNGGQQASWEANGSTSETSPIPLPATAESVLLFRGGVLQTCISTGGYDWDIDSGDNINFVVAPDAGEILTIVIL